MWDTIAAVVSTLIAGVGLLAGWFSWRRSELRRDDVLIWANEAIEALQTLLLICILRDPPLDKDVTKNKVASLIFQTSVLVERGRLFFKNEVIDDYGKEKAPAYRGYRPLVLDQIIIAHQIACHWSDANDEEKLRMRIIAENALKKFVSLIQKEIGRGRTASADTKSGGEGVALPHLMNMVDRNTLEKLKKIANRDHK
jgi:hypothetical protein